jgi:O-antigen/teichoic acid export membrane protein
MPLYFGDLANVSFVYLDRYVVGLFLSPTALGIYVLYWSITNALSNLVTTSFVQIQRGLLVKVASASDRSLNRPLGRICLTSGAMSLALSMAATLMMYVVVPHLGRPEAEAYLPLMFVLSAALVLRTLYEVVGISFYAYGRDDLVLYSVIGVLLVALTLNLWFDPRVGIWGAGGALVASYAIGWVGRTVMMLRGFRLRPRPDRKAPAAISGMANGRS